MIVIFRFLNNGHFGHTKMTPYSKNLDQFDRYFKSKWPLFMPKMTLVVFQNDRYISKYNSRSCWGRKQYFDHGSWNRFLDPVHGPRTRFLLRTRFTNSISMILISLERAWADEFNGIINRLLNFMILRLFSH